VNLFSHIAGISTNGSSRKNGQPFFHLPFFLKNLNSCKSFLSAGLNSLRGLNERRNVDKFRFINECKLKGSVTNCRKNVFCGHFFVFLTTCLDSIDAWLCLRSLNFNFAFVCLFSLILKSISNSCLI